MKAFKITIALLFCSFLAKAQRPQRIVTWYEYGKFNVERSLSIPRDTFPDADTSAIAVKVHKLFIKDSTGHWFELSGDNFANTDLAATANRTHNFSGHGIRIDSLLNFANGLNVFPKYGVRQFVSGKYGDSLYNYIKPSSMGDVVSNPGGAYFPWVFGWGSDAAHKSNVALIDSTGSYWTRNRRAFKVYHNTAEGGDFFTEYNFSVASNDGQVHDIATTDYVDAAVAAGGGTTGNTNSNLGSGFRLAIPGTNNIKTITCSGCTLDSGTSNQIGITVTPYTLPTASASVLGGVKVDNSTITITDGVISAVGSGLDTLDIPGIHTQNYFDLRYNPLLTFNPVTDARTLTVNGTTQDLTTNRTFTVTDANLSTSDITTNDASTTKHGFLQKLPGDDETFLRADGVFELPPGSIRTVPIQALDSANNHWRMDGQTMIMDGTDILTVYQHYNTSSTMDAGDADLWAARSTDGGFTWGTPYSVIEKLTGTANILEPSLYKQSDGDILCIAFVGYSGSSPLQSTIGVWKSTDDGATFSFVDTLDHGLGAYIYPAQNMIVKSPNSGRLFLPINYLTAAPPGTQYKGRYFYSDDDGDTWTLSANTITSPDNFVKDLGMYITPRLPNTTNKSEQLNFYWSTNTLNTLYGCNSIDNGATLSVVFDLGIPSPYSTPALTSGYNNYQNTIGVTNRLTGEASKVAVRSTLDLIASPDWGRTWKTLFSLEVGHDSTLSFFEPSVLIDSARGNIIVGYSKWINSWARSGVWCKVIPIKAAAIPQFGLESMLDLAVLPQDMTSNSATGFLRIYNRSLGDADSYIHLSSASSATNNYWPSLKFKAHSGINGGVLMNSIMGVDASGTYSQAGYVFDASNPSDAALTAAPIANFSSHHVLKFSIGFDGRTEIGNASSSNTTKKGWLTLPAGTTAIPSLFLNSSTLTTTALNGALEYNGTNLFFTRAGAVRENVLTESAVNTVSPTAPDRTIAVNIDGTTYYISAKTTND